MRMFPVLMSYWEQRKAPNCPRAVPWSLLAPHEAVAQRNHGQTLERLAERGGLGAGEMVGIIEGKRFTEYPNCVEAVPRLLELLAAHGSEAK